MAAHRSKAVPVLWTPSDVARLTGLYQQGIGGWIERGHIRLVARTPGGIRLLDPVEVRAYLKQRTRHLARLQAQGKQPGGRPKQVRR